MTEAVKKFLADSVKPVPTLYILSEIAAERVRQDTKWGEQNHASLSPVLTNHEGGASATDLCWDLEIPTADRARFLCEAAFKRGDGSWAHIASEEFSEAICAETPDARRAELVQLAAVVVAWIECIDRNAARQINTPEESNDASSTSSLLPLPLHDPRSGDRGGLDE